MKIKIILFVLLAVWLATAQVAAPPTPEPANAQPAASPYVSQVLPQLELVSQSTVMNLGRIKVDKWKTDGRDKDQARSNIESLQRNLTSALPTLVQDVRNNPASLGAAVKLYRNLNAVYDVLASVTESTGAFGSKDDYRALANDTANLDNVRRTFADDLERLATSMDGQISRLTAQIRAQQAATAAAAAQPTRKIVDDTAPPKKKATTKKKTAAKPATTPK